MKEIGFEVAKASKEDKMKSDLTNMAFLFKSMVDAYILAGFTREEAISICCNLVKQ